LSRRATFHTSPHRLHRQYVSAFTTLLVVVTLAERQAGQHFGRSTTALLASIGSPRFAKVIVSAARKFLRHQFQCVVAPVRLFPSDAHSAT
jgi:hypothetical protein